MKTLKSVIAAFVISAGLCPSSYGFEWLDNLLGIDLDNSQAAPAYPLGMTTYRPYPSGFAPYGNGQPVQAGAAGYALYRNPASSTRSYGHAASAAAPLASYRTFYRPVPVTAYRAVVPCHSCGKQVTTMRPVVAHQMHMQVMPYNSNQSTYAPAPSYAPAVGRYPPNNWPRAAR
jgi:hypothetical protein